MVKLQSLVSMENKQDWSSRLRNRRHNQRRTQYRIHSFHSHNLYILGNKEK